MTQGSREGIDRMFADVVPMDPTEALTRIRALILTEPNFKSAQESGELPIDALKWLGQLRALVDKMKIIRESVNLGLLEDRIIKSKGKLGGDEIRALLYRVLAHAEMRAPVAAQGAFIASGNEFDAFGALCKVLESAKESLLVIDPYLDAKMLTDFLPAVAEGRSINLLSDKATVKGTLIPAAERWMIQHGAGRPLAVRLAPERSLHDRLIIVDSRTAWSLTQSVKDFAKRAHAAILKVDDESADLKIAAYSTIWDQAEQIL